MPSRRPPLSHIPATRNIGTMTENGIPLHSLRPREPTWETDGLVDRTKVTLALYGDELDKRLNYGVRLALKRKPRLTFMVSRQTMQMGHALRGRHSAHEGPFGNGRGGPKR